MHRGQGAARATLVGSGDAEAGWIRRRGPQRLRKVMRKIINNPDRFVDETIAGILAAHPGALRAASADARVLVRTDAGRRGKVGIVTGGGSGHLPAFLGYVGVGLCDGVAVGNTFSSPSAEQVAAATRAVDGGAGVLYLYGNYGGDIYNFDLAADLVASDGVRTRTVLAQDDVASAPGARRSHRRGVAGMVYGFKIAGAAAERGDDLDQVADIAERVVANTRTMGVGISPTILPAAGQPTFELEDGEMEVGVGIHGEPGIHRGRLESADEIAQRLTGGVLDDLAAPAGSTVSVMVNGLGATPLEELYVVYARVSQLVMERGLQIRAPLVGNFVTSLEMAGASVSVLLLDDELSELLDAPAASPFFQRGGQPELQIAAENVTAPDVVSPDWADRPDADPTPLARLLLTILDRMPAHAEELRRLDAALGDGDLGVTISAGSAAAAAAIRRDPSLGEADLVKRVGAAFASANPSTFAALIGGALVSSSSDVGPDLLTRAGGLRLAGRVAERIAARGGAKPGDKTVLDVLLVQGETLDVTIKAVQDLIQESSNWTSARGRAAWLQERSVGLQDPGMTAYLDFLFELREAYRAEHG